MRVQILYGSSTEAKNAWESNDSLAKSTLSFSNWCVISHFSQFLKIGVFYLRKLFRIVLIRQDQKSILFHPKTLHSGF